MSKKHLGFNAASAGFVVAMLVISGIYFGSRGLTHFDPAVMWYAVGSVLAAFAVAYRFTLWAQRPPSRMYFKRGLQLLFRRPQSHVAQTSQSAVSRVSKPAGRSDTNARLECGRPADLEIGDTAGLETCATPPAASHFNSSMPSGPGTLGAALATNFVAQNFIRRRSAYRWIMHLCLSGGCTLAFAITFPLVFGWVHFESLATDGETYHVHVFGFAVDSFRTHGMKSFLMFNLLNISAVIVLVGLVMAAWRRMTDAGERATQTFSEDILPLILIFAVTATGLMLTVSYKLLEGRGHALTAVVHTVSVIALLFYIPFGKLFHMFQRTCSLCVSLYKKAGATGPRALCRGCGEDYASEMHVTDLVSVLDQLGFDYRFATAQGEIHYQEICPACRRRMLALSQGRTVGR